MEHRLSTPLFSIPVPGTDLDWLGARAVSPVGTCFEWKNANIGATVRVAWGPYPDDIAREYFRTRQLELAADEVAVETGVRPSSLLKGPVGSLGYEWHAPKARRSGVILAVDAADYCFLLCIEALVDGVSTAWTTEAALKFDTTGAKALGSREDSGVKIERVYPYLAPADYLDRPTDDDPILGDTIALLFGENLGDGTAVRVLKNCDLRPVGLDPDSLWQTATTNLINAAQAGIVSLQVAQAPRGGRMLTIFGNWLAASCLYLPDLPEFSAHHIGSKDLLAIVPYQDLLVVYENLDEDYHAEVRGMFAPTSPNFGKSLTWQPFRLLEDGPEPYVPKAQP